MADDSPPDLQPSPEIDTTVGGTGLPAVDNTHEVARRVAPESGIVYADPITRWRPEVTPFGEPEQIDQFSGIGRKL